MADNITTMVNETTATETNPSAEAKKETEKRPFPFWRIIYKNLILIIAIIIACSAVGIALGFTRAKDVYTASSRIILKASFGFENDNNFDITTSLNNNALAKRSLPTIASAIKTPRLVDEAKKKVDGETGLMSTADNGIAHGAIGVVYDDESLIFTVSYSDVDKDKVSTRLERVIWAIQNKLPLDYFPGVTNIEFVKTNTYKNEGGVITSEYDISVSNPRYLYIIGSVIVGIALALCAVFLVYVLDNKIKDSDELEEITGASVLSVISK